MKMSIRFVLFMACMTVVVSSPSALAHTDVTPAQARDLIDSTDNLIVVDVREPGEYCDAVGHIPGALNYPLNSGVLQARYEELPVDGPVLVVCRSGGRSNAAANFLDSKGFTTVYDMMGGMSAWTGETVPCKYSGGTGTPEDPYQIATAGDLIALGETTEDYDKHFILTADIDLDPNLPGRTIFDRAVIASYSVDYNWVNGQFETVEKGGKFVGSFNGNGYTVRNVHIEGYANLGLFGVLSGGALIVDLGVEQARIKTLGLFGRGYMGILVGLGEKGSSVANCFGTGSVQGKGSFGGLVGYNAGSIATSFSTAQVNGEDYVGGLVGRNIGTIVASYSTSSVRGDNNVGGLVGWNYEGSIITSYSMSTVIGVRNVGGLLGNDSSGNINMCYSIGAVHGESDVGGLVGGSSRNSVIINSFWDIESSIQSDSSGGLGLTTTEMQDTETYLRAGWDFTNENVNGRCDYWKGMTGDYPGLSIHTSGHPVMPEGSGTPQDPYRIRDISDLGTVWIESMACYRLEASLDLSGTVWSMAAIPVFSGTFNGNGNVIKNLCIEEGGCLGLFGHATGARISNLGLEAVDVNGTGNDIGGLLGRNESDISYCYCIGAVQGRNRVGSLAGYNNSGSISACYGAGTVNGFYYTGGLVGRNNGNITTSYSTGTVNGRSGKIGGLVGWNHGVITNSYSLNSVSGGTNVGGLVGENEFNAIIHASFSTGVVNGNKDVGGFVGYNRGSVTSSCWDTHLSDLLGSDGGVGLTSKEMMDPEMLGLNGFADDPNWVLDPHHDYPRLSWEGIPGDIIPSPEINWLNGNGTLDNPYRLIEVDELIRIGKASILSDSGFVLMNDIALSGFVWHQAIIPLFNGEFDGNGYWIQQLHIEGSHHLGLFGHVGEQGTITHLGMKSVNIDGTGRDVGSIAGDNRGNITHCFSTGIVNGHEYVGGVTGFNRGTIIKSNHTGIIRGSFRVGGLTGYNSRIIEESYSRGTVNASGNYIGGLAGYNTGRISRSFSATTVRGNQIIGGLVGKNLEIDIDKGHVGTISASYSTGSVIGGQSVGGLVGDNEGTIRTSYSRASVGGAETVGGLVGRNYDATITTCYSTGLIDGYSILGGLVGEHQYGTIEKSFWNMDTSRKSRSAGGTGLTTTEMQDINTFLDAEWDFNDDWVMPTEPGYPLLWWEAE